MKHKPGPPWGIDLENKSKKYREVIIIKKKKRCVEYWPIDRKKSVLDASKVIPPIFLKISVYNSTS